MGDAAGILAEKLFPRLGFLLQVEVGSGPSRGKRVDGWPAATGLSGRLHSQENRKPWRPGHGVRGPRVFPGRQARAEHTDTRAKLAGLRSLSAHARIFVAAGF